MKRRRMKSPGRFAVLVPVLCAVTAAALAASLHLSERKAGHADPPRLSACLSVPSSDAGLSPRTGGKAVLVFLDRIGLSDLNQADTPHIDRLIQSGGIGLMTTNTGGNRSQRDTYITMGAGTRAIGSAKSSLAFDAAENYQDVSAASLYQQISGRNPPAESVVDLGYAQLIRNNSKKPYTVTIGALGTALRDAGYHAAAVGNCDTPNEYHRYLASFLMDDQGIIPKGSVDRSFLVEDNERPFGVRTDYQLLYGKVQEIWSDSDVIAIQLGDTSRAEDFRQEATDAMNERYKKAAIEESDAFIGRLADRLDLSRDLILIVTPLGPARDLAENNRLTPVVAAGPGLSGGLLSSASTRRSGVITNLDIGATVLDYFNIPRQPGQLGSRLFTTSLPKGPAGLEAFNKRLTEIYNQRRFLLRSYVVVLVTLLILSLLVVFFARAFLPYVKVCLVFLMVIPISYLLLTLFHQSTTAGSFLLSWLLAAGITGLFFLKKQNTLNRIAVLCFTMAGLLLGDQLTGAHLIQGSPLGYDVISGARFYGIGNEYMGILIGSVCSGAGVFCEIQDKKGGRAMRWAVPALFALTLFILADPGLGAKVGGIITATTAFACFFLLMRKGRIRLLYFIPIALLVVALLTGIFMFDSTRAADRQTHMGLTVRLIRQNGLMELLYIMKRKIQMNVRLIRYTIWTRVFLLSLLAMTVLIFRPVGIFRDMTQKYPKAIKGFAAAILGCITALLVNDSGIVAAGTGMIYTALPVLLLVMDQLSQEKETAGKKTSMGNGSSGGRNPL